MMLHHPVVKLALAPFRMICMLHTAANATTWASLIGITAKLSGERNAVSLCGKHVYVMLPELQLRFCNCTYRLIILQGSNLFCTYLVQHAQNSADTQVVTLIDVSISDVLHWSCCFLQLLLEPFLTLLLS